MFRADVACRLGVLKCVTLLCQQSSRMRAAIEADQARMRLKSCVDIGMSL
jgi:hypothetical protein